MSSGNKLSSEPMSTRTEFYITIWRHWYCLSSKLYSRTRSRAANDLKRHDDHVASLLYKCSKRRFRYYKKDNVSNGRVCLIPLLLARTCFWKTVEWPVIWKAMTIMWLHCYNSASKGDFGITNDYISNARVWRFPLLLAKTFPWTNSPSAGDLKHHDAQVTSL